MSDNDSLKTVSRSISVLKLFSPNEREFTLTEFQNRLGISLSSLQRILSTLTKGGFLEKNEATKTYRLGLELYFLGNLVESHSQLISVSKEEMNRLNEVTQETVTLNVIHGNQRRCIGYVLAKHELTTLAFISNESPLYAGASAKVLLANIPEHEQKNILEEIELQRITEYTTIDKKELENELRRIKERGYAITESERVLGVYAVSSPLMDRFGNVLAGITLTIPSVRVEKDNRDNYIYLVQDCARRISGKLGFKA